MVTLESLYNDVKTLMKQFFYDKDEIFEGSIDLETTNV